MPKSRGGIVSAHSIGLIFILAVVVANLLVFRPGSAQETEKQPPPDADSQPVLPQAQKRIDHDVAVLSKETTEETLSRLSQVDMFFWPGVPGEEPISLGAPFPVPSEAGMRDVEQLISCRRLVKAYQNLAALPKPEATALVDRQLAIAFDEYKKMYEDFLRTNKPYTGPDGRRSGPSFLIGGDKPTLMGYRLQVLGLVFLAGNLELKGTAPSVRAIAKQATEEYDRLKSPDVYPGWFGTAVVKRASLYSRQVLAIGLIGTLASQDDPVAAKYRGQMKVVKWPEFNARVTPFDQPAMWGGVPVGKKPIKFRTLGELTDEDLAKLVAAASP